MVQLPTFDIPPGPVLDRVYAAFDSSEEQYLEWLKEKIKEHIILREGFVARQSLEQQINDLVIGT